MIKRQALVCLLISPLMLGGCSLLPVSFQVASMALDGISLLTTQKSLTDHGISAFAEKDCAMWRGLTESDICQDYEDQPNTVLAALDTSTPSRLQDQGHAVLDTPYLSIH
jgi:hypothetical protein